MTSTAHIEFAQHLATDIIVQLFTLAELATIQAFIASTGYIAPFWWTPFNATTPPSPVRIRNGKRWSLQT